MPLISSISSGRRLFADAIFADDVRGAEAGFRLFKEHDDRFFGVAHSLLSVLQVVARQSEMLSLVSNRFFGDTLSS